MTLEERYENVRERIDKACADAHRDKNGVRLICVTKTRTPEEINAVLSLGAREIGENRVQELASKVDAIDPRARVHLIGQLQTNKVRSLPERVELIHSLDRLSLAETLEKAGEKRGRPFEALVEVNVGREASKSGIFPENLSDFLDILQNFRYIKVKGLMTVAPKASSPAVPERCFAEMRELLSRGQAVFGADFRELSMGMSGDFEAAIRQGATMVRVGTAIFGERNYQ